MIAQQQWHYGTEEVILRKYNYIGVKFGIFAHHYKNPIPHVVLFSLHISQNKQYKIVSP